MADKVFGQDFTDITSPVGTETISTLQAGTMKDVTLSNVVSGVTHNATSKSTPVDADELPISDSAASNVLKKLTWANLKATFMTSLGALITALTGKTTPVDADEFVIQDSAAGNATKKLTWANLKATFMTSLGVLITNLTSKATPVDADEFVISDSAASNATKKLTWSNVKAVLKLYFDSLYTNVVSGPSGWSDNYVITPSVSSNNLTIALKTIAGADPSTTSPIKIRLKDVVYTVSAATSFTKNAGTNWCNSGGAEMATNAVDYFLYAIGETGASAGIKFGFSRVPYADTMGDFVNTSTSEKYIAGNWTNFNSTDKVEVIGRFRATLSAGAGYTWSIATANVANRPIYNSDWLLWTPQYTGFSANPSYTSAYKLNGEVIHFSIDIVGAGTSNATTVTMTFPFAIPNSNNFIVMIETYDNGAHQAAPGHAISTAGSNSIALYKSIYAGAWTNSGGKAFNIPPFFARLR